jgi:hypothetical protein
MKTWLARSETGQSAYFQDKQHLHLTQVQVLLRRRGSNDHTLISKYAVTAPR